MLFQLRLLDTTTMFSTKALKSKSSAFTLIELLVVIAIIAILAAILFPVFARARENARRSSCQSNLKQIGLGLLQYTQDYDEKLPFADYDTNGAQPWQLTLQPYLKSTQIFKCPSNASTANNIVANSNPTGVANGGIPVSYVCNGGGSYSDSFGGAFGLNADGSNGDRPINRGADGSRAISGGAALAQFASTSQTIVVFENANPNSANADLYNASDLAPGNTPLQNHLGTTNFLFADGHVKSLKPLNTVAGGVNEWLMNPVGATVGTTLQNSLGANQTVMN